MRDTDHYAQILGLKAPWQVAAVSVDAAAGEVTVKVEAAAGTVWACPTCGKPTPGYDRRTRRWGHLDTCRFKTILEADVPRLQCSEHGVLTIDVPWAEPGSGFTSLFEALVIDWLKEASIKAVATQLRLSLGAIDGVMTRAVKRGLARREVLEPRFLSVDETSFQKRHEYVTVVTDQGGGRVLYVADDRKAESLEGFYEGLSEAQKEAVVGVAMDMWPAYVNTTKQHIPGAAEKTAFDKFHVAKYLGEAVDKVRRQEHRALTQVGRDDLKGTKFDWLKNPANMTRAQLQQFAELRDSTLKTARAWAIKELAMALWHYKSRTWAEKGWKGWLAWAMRSRLEPVKKAARTIKRHLWGIINAVVLKLHNGHAESMNSRIQRIKRRACGLRSRERFRNAIYRHLGGLNLYPTGVCGN